MKVVLAGYNVDREALDEVRRFAPGRLDLTPETLSAAYARISRDPRPVEELRQAARSEVDKARRSNRTIIFKMGHHSVAEHAVFNFDIGGVSRLAIEEIEKFRLCSFTEKSQRYIKLGDDYVVPEEIVRSGKRPLFETTIRAQNALYHALYAKLKPHVFAANPEAAADPGRHALLDGWAKEDARYAVSLATEGQLGLTVNARNLELMIRRFAAHPSAEIQALNRMLAEEARRVAPSIVLFTEATPFDAETAASFRERAEDVLGRGRTRPARVRGPAREPAVRLIEATPDGDDRILAALLHAFGGRAYDRGRAEIRRLSVREKRALFLTVFERMEFYDFPPREFEHGVLTFELTVSASCFAQIKRHRMATLTVQDYDPSLGATVPPSIEAVGEGSAFRELIARTGLAYAVLKEEAGTAAAYVLTNAHRRRVLLKVNLRELYHISRLREDASAQWDIRRVSAGMARLARARFPLAGILLGGKDAYPELYRKIFGRLPAVVPPKT
ncbi:MAG: FAD-dependent thymidylate synthase [Candidatus Aminicenantes bacterium]|nr:FAD-dependent thymidylate synthase [Candidatus Aminicenantes bacterium]